MATSILRPFTFCPCRRASRQNGISPERSEPRKRLLKGCASKSGRFRLFRTPSLSLRVGSCNCTSHRQAAVTSLRMPPKHTLRVRDHQLSGLRASPATIGSAWLGLRPRGIFATPSPPISSARRGGGRSRLTHQSMSVHRQSRSVRRDERHCRCGSSRNPRRHVALCGCDRRKRIEGAFS